MFERVSDHILSITTVYHPVLRKMHRPTHLTISLDFNPYQQLNLRPGMMLKPQGPSMLPPSAIKAAPMSGSMNIPLNANGPTPGQQVAPGHPGSGVPGLQPAAFQQIPIRQKVPSTEKEKKGKKPTPTRQELLKIIVSFAVKSNPVSSFHSVWTTIREININQQ